MTLFILTEAHKFLILSKMRRINLYDPHGGSNGMRPLINRFAAHGRLYEGRQNRARRTIAGSIIARTAMTRFARSAADRLMALGMNLIVRDPNSLIGERLVRLMDERPTPRALQDLERALRMRRYPRAMANHSPRLDFRLVMRSRYGINVPARIIIPAR